MARALIINEVVKRQIAALIEQADANPISLEILRSGAVKDDKEIIALADRRPGFERPASAHLEIPVGYRVALSTEDQPAGRCRHLSISVAKKGMLPHADAAIMIMEHFGVTEVIARWLEEFEPGHHAINVVWLA